MTSATATATTTTPTSAASMRAEELYNTIIALYKQQQQQKEQLEHVQKQQQQQQHNELIQLQCNRKDSSNSKSNCIDDINNNSIDYLVSSLLNNSIIESNETLLKSDDDNDMKVSVTNTTKKHSTTTATTTTCFNDMPALSNSCNSSCNSSSCNSCSSSSTDQDNNVNTTTTQVYDEVITVSLSSRCIVNGKADGSCDRKQQQQQYQQYQLIQLASELQNNTTASKIICKLVIEIDTNFDDDIDTTISAREIGFDLVVVASFIYSLLSNKSITTVSIQQKEYRIESKRSSRTANDNNNNNNNNIINNNSISTLTNQYENWDPYPNHFNTFINNVNNNNAINQRITLPATTEPPPWEAIVALQQQQQHQEEEEQVDVVMAAATRQYNNRNNNIDHNYYNENMNDEDEVDDEWSNIQYNQHHHQQQQQHPLFIPPIWQLRGQRDNNDNNTMTIETMYHNDTRDTPTTDFSTATTTIPTTTEPCQETMTNNTTSSTTNVLSFLGQLLGSVLQHNTTIRNLEICKKHHSTKNPFLVSLLYTGFIHRLNHTARSSSMSSRILSSSALFPTSSISSTSSSSILKSQSLNDYYYKKWFSNHITSLDLSGCNIGSSIETMTALVKALQWNSPYTSNTSLVSSSSSKVATSGTVSSESSYSYSCTSVKSLTNLSLVNTNLNDTTLQQICIGLQYHPTIQLLDISNNTNITDNGFVQSIIYSLLRTNDSITCLKLYNIPISTNIRRTVIDNMVAASTAGTSTSSSSNANDTLNNTSNDTNSSTTNTTAGSCITRRRYDEHFLRYNITLRQFLCDNDDELVLTKYLTNVFYLGKGRSKFGYKNGIVRRQNIFYNYLITDWVNTTHTTNSVSINSITGSTAGKVTNTKIKAIPATFNACVGNDYSANSDTIVTNKSDTGIMKNKSVKKSTGNNNNSSSNSTRNKDHRKKQKTLDGC